MIGIKTDSYRERIIIERRKSKIIEIIIIFSAILIISACCYILIRSDKMYRFRNELDCTRFDNSTYFLEFKEIMKTRNAKYKMLFSFKPLKTDKWFTQEEIKKFGFNTE